MLDLLVNSKRGQKITRLETLRSIADPRLTRCDDFVGAVVLGYVIVLDSDHQIKMNPGRKNLDNGSILTRIDLAADGGVMCCREIEILVWI